MVKITQAHLLNSGWVQKSFRIDFEYMKLCEYLVFYATKQGLDRHFIFDTIFNHSLTKLNYELLSKRFNYSFSKVELVRESKGILLHKNTYNLFENVYNVLNEQGINIKIGEFVELLFFIYCTDLFDEIDTNAVAMHWTISKTN